VIGQSELLSVNSLVGEAGCGRAHEGTHSGSSGAVAASL
jgi:hypothetical protein